MNFKTRSYRSLIPLLIACACLSSHALAGDTKSEIYQMPEPVDPWEFSISVPGWVAGVYGQVGIDGLTSNIDVGPDEILKNAYGIFSIAAEARKGRFGIGGDFLFVGVSGSQSTNDLVKNIDYKVDQMIGDFGVQWRLIDSEKGTLDAMAGFRYVNLYQELTLRPADERIEAASTNLVDEVSRRLRTRLTGRELWNLIDNRITSRLDILDNRDPAGPFGPLAGREKRPIRQGIKDIIESRRPDLRTALQQAVQARTAELRAQARARANAIERNLSNRISRSLETRLDRTFERRDFWFDPIIGLRGRYNLSPAWYLTASGDIGGFGVGSEFTWQAQGAVGCQLTKSLYAEAGYRALGIDYRANGLVYDVILRGAQVTMGIKF